MIEMLVKPISPHAQLSDEALFRLETLYGRWLHDKAFGDGVLLHPRDLDTIRAELAAVEREKQRRVAQWQSF